MKKKYFMLVFGASIIIVLLIAILFPQMMIAPGELIAAHEDLTTDCFSCHTPFFGSTPEKCTNCHKIETIGKKPTRGLFIAQEHMMVAFHQHLTEANCMSCHSDHMGVKPFRPVGHFEHGLIDPSLQKQCTSCHNRPDDSLHQTIKENCIQCHTQTKWTPATMNHEKYFRFDRDHTDECVTCHVNNYYAEYTCYGCHEHSPSKIREEHVEEGIYNYETCVDCHRSADEDAAKHLKQSPKSKYPQDEKYESDHDDHDDHDDHEEEDD